MLSFAMISASILSGRRYCSGLNFRRQTPGSATGAISAYAGALPRCCRFRYKTSFGGYGGGDGQRYMFTGRAPIRRGQRAAAGELSLILAGILLPLAGDSDIRHA